jgi:single-strand DNA-binding protein
MSRGMNSCQFIGNLGADPELRTAGNSQVVNVSLAVNEQWGTGKEKKERVEWVPLVIWGRLAEVVKEYARKGAKLWVQGRWQTRNWDDKSGNKQYRTELVVREMLLLDVPGSSGSRGPSDGQRRNPNAGFEAEPVELSDSGDDLPF